MLKNTICPHCHCEDTVKNGKTYYGKQNYKCKYCKRQFVERSYTQGSAVDLNFLKNMFLERISLRGIGRILQKSYSWVYHQFISHIRSDFHLNLPDLECFNEIELFCIEADEMWSFVQNKSNKQWIWLAVERRTKLILGFHIGSRNEESAQGLKYSIPQNIRDKAYIFTDDFPAYRGIFRKGQLKQESKKETTIIESINAVLRARCSRLVRKTKSFSKSWKNHYFAIKYFIELI